MELNAPQTTLRHIQLQMVRCILLFGQCGLVKVILQEQRPTIPFHCVSLWDGDKISKIWRYMDPSALQKEIAAYEGVNNSSTKVMGLADLKVSDGFTKNDIKEFMVEIYKVC